MPAFWFAKAQQAIGIQRCDSWPVCRKRQDNQAGRSAYEPGGQEFESLRARQLNQKLRMVLPIDLGAFAYLGHNQVHDRPGVRTRSCRRPLWVIICTLRAVLPCEGLFLTFSPGVPARPRRFVSAIRPENQPKPFEVRFETPLGYQGQVDSRAL
jgi:hypothetical protein